MNEIIVFFAFVTLGLIIVNFIQNLRIKDLEERVDTLEREKKG